MYPTSHPPGWPARLGKKAQDRTHPINAAPAACSLVDAILPSLHSPPLLTCLGGLRPDKKIPYSVRRSSVPPEVPSKALRAPYPSYAAGKQLSLDRSLRSVSCGPFPATVGFHSSPKTSTSISPKCRKGCQARLFASVPYEASVLCVRGVRTWGTLRHDRWIWGARWVIRLRVRPASSRSTYPAPRGPSATY